jgi:hypothetical protein
MMWSFGQHRLRSANGINERVRLDFLMRLDAVTNVEKMAAIHGHNELPVQQREPLNGSGPSQQRKGPTSAEERQLGGALARS